MCFILRRRTAVIAGHTARIQTKRQAHDFDFLRRAALAVGAVLGKLSQAFAMAGGLAFGAPIAMSIVSIVGLVHPQLGMNLFIIQKLARDVPYFETAKGVMPFLASDLVRIVLLVAFPSICLYLVHLNG